MSTKPVNVARGLLTWSVAEVLLPGCSAQWDAQQLTDKPVVIYVNVMHTLSVVEVGTYRIYDGAWYWSKRFAEGAPGIWIEGVALAALHRKLQPVIDALRGRQPPAT